MIVIVIAAVVNQEMSSELMKADDNTEPMSSRCTGTVRRTAFTGNCCLLSSLYLVI